PVGGERGHEDRRRDREQPGVGAGAVDLLDGGEADDEAHVVRQGESGGHGHGVGEHEEARGEGGTQPAGTVPPGGPAPPGAEPRGAGRMGVRPRSSIALALGCTSAGASPPYSSVTVAERGSRYTPCRPGTLRRRAGWRAGAAGRGRATPPR